jgi:RNA polymerase sigma factor (sigma-70 family)
MRVQAKPANHSGCHAAELSEIRRVSPSPETGDDPVSGEVDVSAVSRELDVSAETIDPEDLHGSAEAIDPEERLLRRWRAGDRAAGDELIALCKPVLFWFFRRRTDDNVEELVQGTLAACIQAVDSFEGRSSFKTFLLGIANKQFLMSLRANRQQERSVAQERSGEILTFHPPSPSQQFAIKETAQSLSAAMSSMPFAFRRVLRMFYWGGFSVEEIARILELPAGTVKSRLARGRTMLKERMMEAGRPCGANQQGGTNHVAKPSD